MKSDIDTTELGSNSTNTLRDDSKKQSSLPSSSSEGSENATIQDESHGVRDEKLEFPVMVPVTSHQESVTYPEGGVRAWLVVFGSFSGMLASFGFMNSIGVFQEYISRNQLSDYSQSSIGWIFSMYIFLSFGCGLCIGPIFDAKGPTMLLLIGGVSLIAGVLLMGISTQYWQMMLTIGVLAGVGTSLIFTPAVAAVGHFFMVKRGFATGIAATGGSVGGIIFPLMLQRLLPVLGFAWATRVLALIYLVLCSISVLLVRSRLPPEPGKSILPDFYIFRQPAFALATAGVFFIEWALFIPITYVASFIVDTGAVSLDSSFPFTLIAILNVGSTLGRFAPGYVADKFGRFNSMIVMITLCVATNLGLWLPASIVPGSSSAVKPLTIVFVLFFGFASGSGISLTPVCVGQLCRTEEYGRYYATCYTVVALGSLVGIPIAGALLESARGKYWGTALFTGLCYVVSLLAFGGARWIKVGWNMAVF